MANVEKSGTMKYKDKSGNMTTMYPKTKVANVEGLSAELDKKAPLTHTHTKSQISDFPTSMPASDVKAWAKAATKPSYTASEVGADASGAAAQALTDAKTYTDGKISDSQKLDLPVAATSSDGVAYSATVPGATLTAGYSFIMIPNRISSSTSTTLNVNGLGAKALRVHVSGYTGTTSAPMTNNWLAPNKPVRVTYDGMWWIADVVLPSAQQLYGNVQAEDVDYSNTSSGLVATKVQAAIDELAGGALRTQTMTTAEYEALTTKDENTFYMLSDAEETSGDSIFWIHATVDDDTITADKTPLEVKNAVLEGKLAVLDLGSGFPLLFSQIKWTNINMIQFFGIYSDLNTWSNFICYQVNATAAGNDDGYWGDLRKVKMPQIPTFTSEQANQYLKVTWVDSVNKGLATWSAITPASIGAIPTTEKGAASGVATLGADGKVPTEQLPEMSGGLQMEEFKNVTVSLAQTSAITSNFRLLDYDAIRIGRFVYVQGAMKITRESTAVSGGVYFLFNGLPTPKSYPYTTGLALFRGNTNVVEVRPATYGDTTCPPKVVINVPGDGTDLDKNIIFHFMYLSV